MATSFNSLSHELRQKYVYISAFYGVESSYLAYDLKCDTIEVDRIKSNVVKSGIRNYLANKYWEDDKYALDVKTYKTEV